MKENKKHLSIIFVVLLAFLLFTASVTGENEAELEILKNYAISNYGLDSQSIQTLDFGCWHSDAPEIDPRVCYGSFEDSMGKHVDLWVNLNTSQFYTHKPSFYDLHPDAHPKIDRELYYEMLNASPSQEIRIRVTKKSSITEAEREELNQIGMNVTQIEDKPERWLQLTGYRSVAHGYGTPAEIDAIANLSWVYSVFADTMLVSGFLEFTTGSETPLLSALIVSNSVDMPTAERLNKVFESFNISSKIINASDSEFQNPPQEYTYAIRFILGGPVAYEGVGELSSEYLSEEEEDYLVNTEGSYGFWSKVGIVGKYNKRIIILAGHTRNETALAEMEFEAKGLNKKGLLII